MKPTAAHLKQLLQGQPTLQQLWEAFLRAHGTPPPPDIALQVETTFKLGACFMLFALLEAVYTSDMDSDHLFLYHDALERECREWVEAVAAVEAALRARDN